MYLCSNNSASCGRGILQLCTWVRLITEEKAQEPTENDRVDHHIMVSRGPRLSEMKNRKYMKGRKLHDDRAFLGHIFSSYDTNFSEEGINGKA